VTGSIIVMLVLLCLSGFFSGTETAYTSLSETQIHGLKNRWGKRGALVEHLSKTPQRLITTVLVGNNLVNIALSVLASDMTIRLFGSAALAVTTGIITLLVLVFGEVTPKQLAITHNEAWTAWTARFIYGLTIVFRPVVWFIGLIGQILTKLTGGGNRSTLTRESLLYLMKRAETIGILETFRTQMVRGVFRFTDVSVSAIMTHRTKLFLLDQGQPAEEAFPAIVRSGFSRIPVYAGDPERIVGVALMKEVARLIADGDTDIPIKRVMLQPIYVPENRKIHEMLAQFRREGLNMAIVLDEYGGLAGIVTIEDIVEEVLGEIYDEHEEQEREKITRVRDDTYQILADVPLYVLNDTMNLQIPESRTANTLGGYLAEVAGRIPARHEVLETPHGQFVIDAISRKRIVSVRFTPPQGASEEDSGEF
jgi:CBS domain containing-hemolysin-like protein